MRKRTAAIWITVGFAIVGALALLIQIMVPKLIDSALYRIRYNDFEVSGQVVDQDGAPIEGVIVSVEVRNNLQITGQYDSEHEYVNLKNSPFTITRKKCGTLHLTFFREGYGSFEQEFSRGGMYNNLRVVLPKQPPSATRWSEAR